MDWNCTNLWGDGSGEGGGDLTSAVHLHMKIRNQCPGTLVHRGWWCCCRCQIKKVAHRLRWMAYCSNSSQWWSLIRVSFDEREGRKKNEKGTGNCSLVEILVRWIKQYWEYLILWGLSLRRSNQLGSAPNGRFREKGAEVKVGCARLGSVTGKRVKKSTKSRKTLSLHGKFGYTSSSAKGKVVNVVSKGDRALFWLVSELVRVFSVRLRLEMTRIGNSLLLFSLLLVLLLLLLPAIVWLLLLLLLILSMEFMCSSAVFSLLHS